MPNFIEDDVALGAAKSDLAPIGGGDSTKYIQASDWNEHRTALDDIKKVLRGTATYTNRLGAVADGTSITGSGTAASPFVAIAAAPSGDASLNSLKLFLAAAALDLTLASYNNYDPNWAALGNATNLPIGSSVIGGTTITGMVPHPGGRGQIVTIQNKMPGPPIRIVHMSADSLSSHRILCPNEQDLILPSGGAAILQVMALNDGVHGWRTLGASTCAFTRADVQTLAVGRLAIGPEDTSSPYSIIKGSQITPTALASGQNDNWLPTGFLDAGRIRVTAGASATLTGMGGAADGVAVGDVKVLQAFNAFTLKHQNAGSVATRQFYLPGGVDLVLPLGGAVTLLYDQLQRWWPIGVSK